MNCLDEMSIFAAFEIEGEEQGAYVFRGRSVGLVGGSFVERSSLHDKPRENRQTCSFLSYRTCC
jgi:hypothetical protein